VEQLLSQLQLMDTGLPTRRPRSAKMRLLRSACLAVLVCKLQSEWAGLRQKEYLEADAAGPLEPPYEEQGGWRCIEEDVVVKDWEKVMLGIVLGVVGGRRRREGESRLVRFL
jgi:hypothetical protein